MTRRMVCALALAVTSPVVAQSVPAWHLQLDHAIRSAEGSAGMIGNVTGMAITPSGVVYVSEREPGRVTRYDGQGKFSVFMRNGAGPHEVRDPSIATFGETLLVYDGSLHRFTRMAGDGRLLDQRALDVEAVGFPVWAGRDGTAYVDELNAFHTSRWRAARITRAGRVDSVAWAVDPGSNQMVTYGNAAVKIHGGPFTAAFEGMIDPDGHAVVGGTRASRWVVLAGNDTIRRVAFPDLIVKIPARVRDSAWKVFSDRFASEPTFASALREELLPTTLPAWVTFDIDPVGKWWIGRPRLDGSIAAWDVVMGGKVIGHVPVPTPLAILPAIGSVRAFGDGWVALLHSDEKDVPWIGVYRVVR